MEHYFLNKDTTTNPNNNHEVHTSECIWCPSTYNRVDLGYCNNGIEAVNKAKQMGYSKVDGCATCCPESHRG